MDSLSSNVGGRDADTPAASAEPGPHPLAAELAASLRGASPAPRVLLLGAGSGRNIPVLLGAGVRVDVIDEREGNAADLARRFRAEQWLRIAHARYDGAVPFAAGFDAALSTHAMLHGTAETIAATVENVRAALQPGGRLIATLGSHRDPRFGTGRAIARDTFAPHTGSEAGVAHTYFDERGVRAIFGGFTLEDIVEKPSGTVVGRWAHDETDARSIVHWWIKARRN